ncbi:redoxin domain-containing protein [Phenylobacterium sp. VNQ135]|uniref:monooxygenase n=1 Tax=Phenylobacterium sp. VNQ135 TaxID=3400922 RepID=UPI003C0CD03D
MGVARRAGVRAAVMGLMMAMAAGLLLSGQARAAQTVDNFRLADQNLIARELYRNADAKAVVLVAYASGDAQLRKDAPALAALKRDYAGKGVEMFGVTSRLGEKRDVVKAEAARLGLQMPILFDYQQLVGEQLGISRAAEVFVVDPKSWQVLYRGPAAGARAAVDALTAGRSVAFTQAAAKGSAIAFPAKAKGGFTEISYAHDVAPIIKAKCATCHQPGGIGPMPLNTYEQVKGFSPMIREVIRTNRMPPYMADQTVGHFKDDDRLSPEQIKTLVHWIEGGAPRGQGEDPLAKIDFKAPDWPLGKPDVIVEIPAFAIPAQGVLDYQRPVVPSVMTEGRWMKATTFRVTDRQAVHHILTGVVDGNFKTGDTATETQWGASLGGYGPGRGSNINPDDHGVWVPPSGGVAFQNHYTPYGRETVEKTQMGMYFYPKGQEPKYVLRTMGIFDFSIVIPANTEEHHEHAYIQFPKEAILYGLTPHAHHRGASASVSVIYPDGREEMLLSLPRYDFNWQYEYFLAEPLKIPAGTKVVTRYTYDNSRRNPANPDPNKVVTWGEQSWEEMLATYLHYRWVDETVQDQKPDYDKQLQATLFMGAMDDDFDGKLQKAELKGQTGDMMAKFFGVIDKNTDGALDPAELREAQKLMPRRRQSAEAETPKAPGN